MKTKEVSFDRFLKLERDSKHLLKSLAKLAKRFDRLTNHVNREIGVAQKMPLHARIKQANK